MPKRHIRQDSSPEELLRALNTAVGNLLEVIDVPPRQIAQSRYKELKRIRRLVSIHLRQAKEENDASGDHGSRSQ